jgi:hypothetical protein
MKTLTKTLLAGSMCLFAALPAVAGHGNGYGHGYGYGYGFGSGDIRQRLERQERRIEQGIRSGDLTRWEAQKLQRQQHRIRHLFHDLRDDGRLSHKERRLLNAKLDAASHWVYDLKHNDWERPSHGHRHYGGDHHYRGDRGRVSWRYVEDD